MRVSSNEGVVTLVLLLCGALQAPARAFDFGAAYTADVLANIAGGAARGVRYLDNLDLMIEAEVGAPAGFGDGRLFVYALYNNGSTFADELVGDLLVSSNIDAPEALRVFELWYEFGDGPWSIRSGLYDLNSEFDVNEAGGLFLNSSHGIGAAFSQTGRNGPSIFPVSSLAIRVDREFGRHVARIAALDGVPGDPDDPASNEIDFDADDGVLVVGELDFGLTDSLRLWTGYWRYTADFESPFDGAVADDNVGWYVGAEQGFVLAGRSAAWFVRYGRASERLNPLDAYAGAGLVVEGPLAARPQDRFGVSVASGRTGQPYRSSLTAAGFPATPHETQWELTYRAQLNDRVAIQPDVQYVHNPSASSRNDHAWIVGVRVELSY